MEDNRFDETDILARTLYGEARGEGLIGLEAVACVILNRVSCQKKRGSHGGDVMYPRYV